MRTASQDLEVVVPIDVQPVKRLGGQPEARVKLAQGFQRRPRKGLAAEGIQRHPAPPSPELDLGPLLIPRVDPDLRVARNGLAAKLDATGGPRSLRIGHALGFLSGRKGYHGR